MSQEHKQENQINCCFCTTHHTITDSKSEAKVMGALDCSMNGIDIDTDDSHILMVNLACASHSHTLTWTAATHYKWEFYRFCVFTTIWIHTQTQHTRTSIIYIFILLMKLTILCQNGSHHDCSLCGSCAYSLHFPVWNALHIA